MSLDNKIFKESPANNRKTKFFSTVGINTEMVRITEYSNDTKCTVIEPIAENNIVDADSIFIPTDDSLSDFIHGDIGDYLDENVDTTDHNYMKESIRNLLITVVQKNIIHLLTPYKSSDQNNSQEQRQNDESH